MLRPAWTSPAAIVLLTAVYVIAGKLGLRLAFFHASASPVWPPTGIALAALLLAGRRVWPAIFIGAFLVNVTTAGSIVTSAGIALGNTLEGLVGTELLRRFAGGRRAFERAQDIFKFAFLAGLVATTLSATIGVTSLSLAGYARWADYGAIWFTWWLGDAAGALVVAPFLILSVTDRGLTWNGRRIVEGVLLLAVVVGVSLVVFGDLLSLGNTGRPLAFLCLPPLAWAAFRFGPREASTVILVLSATAIQGTLAGVSPFAIGPPNESLLLLQAFMATIAMMTIPMAAAVAERRRTEDALHRSEVAYRQMFEANPHPMWIVDRTTLGFLAVNDAAVARYGYSRAEFLAMTLLDMPPPEDAPRARAAAGDLERGFEVLGVYRHLTRDRRPLDVEVSAHPVTFAGRAAAIVVASDVTARKKTEEERRRRLHAEQIARRHAEDANRAKDEFLATLSHELRTPLTAMLGWATLLRSGELDPATAARAVEIIERNTRLQSQIVEDLLDVSRIVAGTFKMDVAPVDLGPVIQAAVDSVGPAADRKAITIDARLETVGPVLGDPVRLQQIVWNLVSNAVKFTGRGGRIETHLHRVDGQAVITVRDTGKGIRAEFLPHIFDRFRQADSSTTRAVGGLGLGLSIVRHLVGLHGGTVHAVSAGEEKGATFTVRLPIAGAARPAAAGGTDVPPVRQPVLHGLRVLVVDDDADTCEIVGTALTSVGADVRTVVSARGALTELEFWTPDVMVADIAMPDEDGYTLLARARALPGLAGLSALALTAHARAEDRERTLAAGYQRHIAKPVDLDALTRTIAEIAAGAQTPLRADAPERDGP